MTDLNIFGYRPASINFIVVIDDIHLGDVETHILGAQKMTPEEIKQIVEAAVKQELGFIWWHYLLAAIAVCISFFVGSYLKRKGQDLATRENVEKLTTLVESVKQEIRNSESIAQAKRQMKHDACLEALSVIDAFFSHFFTRPKPTPQVADSAKAREVHSKLILACDNPKIIEIYT